MDQYRFGTFTLDRTERKLYADGAPVALGSTDLRLLLALVDRAGAVVSKNDLMSQVWGRAAVSDNALYVHINALRKMLGDGCIVNKQGRGYRFVAPSQRPVPHLPSKQTELQGGNLPSIWTSEATRGPVRLIGRSAQLRAASDLLVRGHLVTLMGHGGVGKTRLAQQAAKEASSDFRDGVWLVELANLEHANLVPGAIASVLGVQIGARAAPLETLSRYLAEKSLLIILDNCEHVIAEAARTSESLLSCAPGIKILATSREALSCFAEQVLDIPPLDVPEEAATAPDMMRRVAAVDLFIERAKEADANIRIDDEELATVARICRRLDGLPLAIEMAAAWAGVLGIEALDAKLDGSLNAWLRARSTAPPRHSTLCATFEWSNDLLSADEQAVLCRLSVFASSFTMAAGEAVAGDASIPEERILEILANLIRKSMIAVVPGQRSPRYRLLETTRAFALEKLTGSGEADAIRQRHASHVLDVLEKATSEWETTGDATWLERYSPVLEDLRAALAWATAANSEDATALAGASWPLWRQLSLPAEGREWLSTVAGLQRPDTAPALEARLRRGLGEMLLNTAASNVAHAELEHAAILYRALGDAPALGSTLTALGFSLFMLGRIEDAEQAILEALNLLEPAGWFRTLATAYSAKLCIEAVQYRFDAAFAAGAKAKRLCEMAGTDRTGFNVDANLMQMRLEKGDIDGAIIAGQDVVARLRDTRHSDLLGFALGILTAAHAARSDFKDALAAGREAMPLLRDDGRSFWLFDHLGLCAALDRRPKDAAIVAGYADAVHERFNRAREPMGRNAIARTALILSDALTDEEIAELRRLGARLSEDQAIAVATGA